MKALIELSCKKFAGRVAYLQMDHRLSYAELEELSGRFGAWLQSQGLQRGDRIAIMLPNILQYPVVMCGALRAGLTVVNTNPLYTERNSSTSYAIRARWRWWYWRLCIHRAASAAINVGTPRDRDGGGRSAWLSKGALVNFVLRHVQRKVPSWTIKGSKSLKSILGSTPDALKPVSVGHEDIAYLQYTGATTGVSKGRDAHSRQYGRECASVPRLV